MRVRATRRGFDNVIRREPGDEFDLPDNTKLDPENDWFVVFDQKAEAKAAAENTKDEEDAADAYGREQTKVGKKR